MQETTINISEELKETIRSVYYKKIGYENLIKSYENGNTPVSIISEYGKACAEFSDIGEQCIIDNWGKPSSEIASSWSCNFDENTFTIVPLQ